MGKRIFLFTFLLFLILGCGESYIHDKNEAAAVEQGTLILFCSDKGQKRAPFASHYFNEQVKKKGLNFYAGFRASNPYNLNKKTISPDLIKEFEEHNIKITHKGIQFLEKEDFDRALSIIHVGNITSSTRIRNPREINIWKIPEMNDDWRLSIDLIKISVDNLIAKLANTTSR